jgi:serine protease Do
VGEKAQVVVGRHGEERTLTVRVAELDSDQETGLQSKRDDRAKWGLQLQDLTPQISQQLGIRLQAGVLVTNVQPDSPADRGGLRRGDVILEVNQSPVASTNEAISAIRGNGEKNLLLTVQRGDGRLFVALSRDED